MILRKDGIGWLEASEGAVASKMEEDRLYVRPSQRETPVITKLVSSAN